MNAPDFSLGSIIAALRPHVGDYIGERWSWYKPGHSPSFDAALARVMKRLARGASLCDVIAVYREAADAVDVLPMVDEAADSHVILTAVTYWLQEKAYSAPAETVADIVARLSLLALEQSEDTFPDAVISLPGLLAQASRDLVRLDGHNAPALTGGQQWQSAREGTPPTMP